MDFELLSKTFLEEVRKRYEAATPGPWVSIVEGRDQLSGDSVMVRGNSAQEDLYLTGATIEDQDFIAHARQDIPLLLEEIERLRKLLNQEDVLTRHDEGTEVSGREMGRAAEGCARGRGCG